jgi:hypothetical protein
MRVPRTRVEREGVEAVEMEEWREDCLLRGDSLGEDAFVASVDLMILSFRR